MHEALAGEKLGGVGKWVSPKAALGLGLKVDTEALPAELVAQIKAGKLRALFDMQKIHKGGFYHDGRFATLNEVVEHYDIFLKLRLSEKQKKDLIEYLKSI